MSTITLPNIRQESAVQMHAKLKDNGVALDWTSLSDVKAYMYSDAQRVIAGKCTVEINAEDSEVLDVLYPATAPQYLGHYSLLVRCTYQGREKTFDVPVVNFVERTVQATGVEVITDPEIDVELEVEDVSTSLLDGAIAAALDAAVRAEEAAAVSEADHLVAVSDHEAAASDHTRAGTDHTRAESDHTTAAGDHTRAGEDHTAAVAAAGAAVAAAELANTKAGLVQDKLDRADTDHTRAESDHTTAVSDHGRAGTDHTTAASDHSTAANDHTIAGNDHTQAASDHGTAAADHTLAASDHTTAAGDHDTAGDDHTQAVADHGTASTDHGTAVADHTLAASDHTTAAGDHTQAGTDHSTAAADHTTAGTDHTTAAADHTQAGSDHTQAGTDHSTAAADHTQAVADHAVMSGYDTRLGNVETEVSQLDQEVTGLVEVTGLMEASVNLFDAQTAENCHLFKSGDALFDGSSMNIQSYIVEVKPNTTVTVDQKTSGARFYIYSTAVYPAAGVVPVQSVGNNSATSQAITLGATEKWIVIYVNNTATPANVSNMRVYYGTAWVTAPSTTLASKATLEAVTGKRANNLDSLFTYTTPSSLPILSCIVGVATWRNDIVPTNFYILKMWRQANTDKLFIQFSKDGSSLYVQQASIPLTNETGVFEYRLLDADFPVVLYIDVATFLTVTAGVVDNIKYKFNWSNIVGSVLSIECEKAVNAASLADAPGLGLYPPFTNIPTVIFRTDEDNYAAGAALVEVLDKYGIKAMFCIQGNILASSGFMEFYKKMIGNGHSLVAHGYTHDDFTSMTDAELRADTIATQKEFAKFGVYPSGVCYPGGQRNDSVDAVLKKVYNYSVIGNSTSGYLNDDPAEFVFKTFSYETKTLAEMKDAVDELIANGKGVLCFGGHGARIGDTTYTQNTLEDIDELCQYIAAAVAAFEVKLISPDRAVAELRASM